MRSTTPTEPALASTASIFLAYMTELDLRGPALVSSPNLRADAEDYALQFISGEEPVEREQLRLTAKRLVEIVATHDAQYDDATDESWLLLREKVRAILVAEKVSGYCE